MKSVYLCGPITSDPVTWQWRTEAKEYLDQRNVLALDPLRGKALGSIKGLGFESNIPGWMFVQRDLIDLASSDAVLCNLLYIPDRQSIGTFMELGIANAKRIPFIVVATHEHVLKHPFITELAVKVVDNVEDALFAIEFILS
jgi:nucleoside 2-deoxyribosyltransferase